MGNIYENVDKPLNLKAVGNYCSLPHCYNGHSFLALGCIPELPTPTYAELRNRHPASHENWLNKDMEDFISQKLYDNNLPYSQTEKFTANIRSSFRMFRNTVKKLRLPKIKLKRGNS